MSFSASALDYNTIGFTPLPVIDKKPCIAGFNNWTGLGNIAIESLSEAHPNADVGILTRISGLLVVDVDSKAPDLVSWVLEEFGYTPLVVSTRHGFHFYYKNPDKIKGVIGDGSYPVDLKGAGKSDFVVAPPSNGYEHVESFLDKEPPNFGNRDLYDFLSILKGGLPLANRQGIRTFFPSHLKATNKRISKRKSDMNVPIHQVANDNSTQHISQAYAGPIPEGTRNRTLWSIGMRYSKLMVAQFGLCTEVYEQLRCHLSDVNRDRCRPALGTSEVLSISDSIWNNYELKGQNFFGGVSVPSDISLSSDGVMSSFREPNAFTLLMWLKSQYEDEHAFCLNREGLASKLNVTPHRIQTSVKILRDEGYVKKVSEAECFKNIAARYEFTEKANALISRTNLSSA